MMNSLSDDHSCAARLKEKGNQSIFEYNTMAFEKRSPCMPVDRDFVYKNHVNTCRGTTPPEFIDNESQILFNQYARGPEKTQHDTRTFVAVPNVQRGTPAPMLESELIFNGDSRQDKYTKCVEPLSEKNFRSECPVFVPAMQQHIDRYSRSITEFETFLRTGTSGRFAHVQHPALNTCKKERP